MTELLVVLEVAVLFLVRIGIPVLVLITLGVIIDRWQSHRENTIRQYYQLHPEKRQIQGHSSH